MKVINFVLKLVLILLLIMPVLGATGIFPPPTQDMYSTPEAFAFIDLLLQTGYITYLISLVFLIAIILILTKRTALAMIIILPITINIVAFHMFLDGGLFTAGAIMGNVLFLINLYFIWQNRKDYASLWKKKTN